MVRYCPYTQFTGLITWKDTSEMNLIEKRRTTNRPNFWKTNSFQAESVLPSDNKNFCNLEAAML